MSKLNMSWFIYSWIFGYTMLGLSPSSSISLVLIAFRAYILVIIEWGSNYIAIRISSSFLDLSVCVMPMS